MTLLGDHVVFLPHHKPTCYIITQIFGPCIHCLATSILHLLHFSLGSPLDARQICKSSMWRGLEDWGGRSQCSMCEWASEFTSKG